MLSLIELDRLEGVEPPLEMVNESRSDAGELESARRSTGAAARSLGAEKEAAPQGRSVCNWTKAIVTVAARSRRRCR
jgi:hypothetical protein